MASDSQKTLTAHSYILLKKKGKNYSCGELVQMSDGRYIPFSYHRYISWKLMGTSAASNEVAALTKDEFLILDAISSSDYRYWVYRTPGKLAWGLGLKVGDTVLAKLPPKDGRGLFGEDYTDAIIRYCGTPTMNRHLFGVEITDARHYGRGSTDGTYNQSVFSVFSERRQLFSCPANCGLFLTLAEIEQPPSPNGAMAANLQEHVTQVGGKIQEAEQLSSSEGRLRMGVARLQGEVREKTREVREKEVTLQGEVRDQVRVLQDKNTTIARLQDEVREKERLQREVDRLQREAREHETALSGLRDQLRGQGERHAAELRQVREEAEQYQQQWRDQQAQHQQLTTRINTAMAHLRGEATPPQQALQLWELPREEVHISQTILGTGGWGYVARGTFQGQPVAVKCLHRGILSPQNEGRVRREISIMAQVRHPNLLLLIGAVLTVEGAGPLIVTELLDRSLRSAYESGLLEERSKLPVLRDVASALTYLHSHHTPIIHRDVSSANVLLEAINLNERQWKAKLSDFGSANLSHLATTPAEGAAVYAAPEVSTEDRSRQTPKIDVYSFGVLACEVCLCRFPPERQEFPSMLREVQGAAPNMFPLARDCTSHTHHNRPGMRDVLQRLDELAGTHHTAL